MTTTLNEILNHNPCASGLTTLKRGLEKPLNYEKPIELSFILQNNGLADMIWVLGWKGDRNAIVGEIYDTFLRGRNELADKIIDGKEVISTYFKELGKYSGLSSVALRASYFATADYVSSLYWVFYLLDGYVTEDKILEIIKKYV